MLTNVEKVKQYLGKLDVDVTDDDLLFELVKRVSDSIEHYCDRKFDAQVFIEHYKGDGSNKLILRQYPIITISGTVDGKELGIWDDVDYVFASNTKKDPASIIMSDQTPGLIQLKGDIFINSQIWSYYNLENIKVAYQAGYVQIPPDLEDSATTIAAVEYSRSKGIISSVKWDKNPKELLQDMWDDLEMHRRIR